MGEAQEDRDAEGSIAPIPVVIPCLDGTRISLSSHQEGNPCTHGPTAPHPPPIGLPACRTRHSSPAATATFLPCPASSKPSHSIAPTYSHPFYPKRDLPAMPRICTVSARVGARRKTCRSMMKMLLCLCVGEKGEVTGRKVSPPASLGVNPQILLARGTPQGGSAGMHEQERRHAGA